MDVWLVPPGVMYFTIPDGMEARHERVKIPRECRTCYFCPYQIGRDTGPDRVDPLDPLSYMLP